MKKETTIILILLFAAIIYYLYHLITRKCSNCGKFGSLKTLKKELISEKATKIKETIKTKNNKGEVIKSREVMVPATTKTFKIYYECKNCKNVETKIDTVTSKN